MKQWEMRGVTVDLNPPSPDRITPTAALPRILLDQFPALVWTTDTNLRLTSCLGSELAALGFWSNQLVGVPVEDLFDPESDDLPALVAHHRALRGEQATFDMTLAGRDYHAHVGPLVDSGGRALGAICIALESARTRPSLAVAT